MKTSKHRVHRGSGRKPLGPRNARSVGRQALGERRRLRWTVAAFDDLRAKYRTVFDAAPIGYVTLDPITGHVLDANVRAAEMLGGARGAIVGRPFAGAVRQEQITSFEEFLRAVVVERKSCSRELDLRCVNGTVLPVRLTLSPVGSSGARRLVVRGMLIDISERRAAAEARLAAVEARRAAAEARRETMGARSLQSNAVAELAKSEERFRLITENIEDVFYIVEPNGELSYVSPSFEHVWARPVAGVVASRSRWPLAVHEADAEAVATAWSSIHGGDPIDVEYRIRVPSGDVRWIRDRAFPRRAAGDVVTQVIGIAHDCTVERELGIELRHAQKVEAVGALASGIAHDFNNLLQAIVACTSIARDESLPVERVRELTAQVHAIALQGGELCHRLGAFTRKEPVRRTPLALDDAIDEVVAILRTVVGRQVALVVSKGAAGATVLADRTQLQQLLLNLASNARDAMAAGGTLAIETSVEAEAGYARLVVRDNGCGMTEATSRRIFTPFFTTKAPGQGTGLGLVTVRRVVQELEGRISFESTEGGGTSFAIELPLCRSASSSADTDRRPVALAATVLLIDDDVVIRRSVRRYLEMKGLRVVEARDPDDARRLCEAHRPDVVLSDVFMPSTTGPALVARLREAFPDLRVLFMSGDPDGARALFTSDANTRMLAKPFAMAELLVELGGLLSR